MIDQIWALVNAQADAAYRDAGGRDRSVTEHVPLPHRRFDAAVALLTGSRGSGVGGGGKAGARGGGRPSVVVTVGIGDLHRGGGRGPARQVGCGPISDELMAEYAAAGDLSLLFEGADGRPLWLGRRRRQASAAQFLALVVRDRGCVLWSHGLGHPAGHRGRATTAEADPNGNSARASSAKPMQARRIDLRALERLD